MHKTDILWAQPSSGGVADQFSKNSPKLRKIFILCNYNTKIKLCQYFIPIIYLNKSNIGAHSEPLFFCFKWVLS